MCGKQSQEYELQRINSCSMLNISGSDCYCEEKDERRCRFQPKLRRAAILRPRMGMTITPYDKLVSWGTTADFIVTLNVMRNGFFGKLLPLFIEEQEKANFGSPFRTEPKTRGRKPLLTKVGLLGFILYLKSRNCMYRICMVFGVVPSTASVWLNYASNLLLKFAQRFDFLECRVA